MTEISAFYSGKAFSLCDLGNSEPSLDNVFMPELETVQLRMGNSLFKTMKALRLVEAARGIDGITEDREQLAMAEMRRDQKRTF